MEDAIFTAPTCAREGGGKVALQPPSGDGTVGTATGTPHLLDVPRRDIFDESVDQLQEMDHEDTNTTHDSPNYDFLFTDEYASDPSLTSLTGTPHLLDAQRRDSFDESVDQMQEMDHEDTSTTNDSPNYDFLFTDEYARDPSVYFKVDDTMDTAIAEIINSCNTAVGPASRATPEDIFLLPHKEPAPEKLHIDRGISPEQLHCYKSMPFPCTVCSRVCGPCCQSLQHVNLQSLARRVIGVLEFSEK